MSWRWAFVSVVLGALSASSEGRAQFRGVMTSPTLPPASPSAAVEWSIPAVPSEPMLPPVSPSGGPWDRAALIDNVTVTVNATDVVRTVDDLMIGLNTAVWDNALMSPETLELLKAADVRTLRFPGGSTSNTYDWETNRSYVSGTRTLNNWEWTNDFDDFAQVALALKAKVYITANYGSGTPEQAAAWVRYSNKEKGYGFKYWEIGNENYGDWEEDIHPLKHHPETYADEAKKFMTLMKAEDPTIKIGVVVLAVPTEEDSWTTRVLARLAAIGAVPDFVVFHRYPYGPGGENDAGLLTGGTMNEPNRTWAVDATAIRQMVNTAFGGAGAGVEIHMTENNSVWTEPGRQSTSLVNGLFYADSFGQILQTEFKSFVWWALHNGPPRDSAGRLLGNLSNSLYGWRNYGDYGVLASADDRVGSVVNDPHPTYWVIKLLRNFARDGDQIVRATSNESLVSAYASKRTNGMLSVLLINKSPTETAKVTLDVNGFAAFPAAPVLSYGIPQDEAARLKTSGREMGMGSARRVGGNGDFVTTLAPYSVNVVTFYPPKVAARLAALAARCRAGTGDQTLIMGFVVEGQKRVLVQGVGPGIAASVPTALTDPLLRLYRLTSGTWTVEAENNDWVNTPELLQTRNRLGASAVAAGSKDAALLEQITGGVYTAHVTTSGAAGVALVEAYDADESGSSRLKALSTRTVAGAGDDTLITGVVLAGDGPKTVLIRGVGPTLASRDGVTGVLADPQLKLFRMTGGASNQVAENNDWGGSAEMKAVFTQIGAGPLASDTSKDAALLVTLDPGVYSVHLSGAGGSTGVALVEIFEVE